MRSRQLAVAIVCDGNRVNQAFFKLFTTVSNEPWRTTNDIFLLFDFVHLLKCVRNNWITEKMQELEFYYEGRLRTAKWAKLKELYEIESKDSLGEKKLIIPSKLSEITVFLSLLNGSE